MTYSYHDIQPSNVYLKCSLCNFKQDLTANIFLLSMSHEEEDRLEDETVQDWEGIIDFFAYYALGRIYINALGYHVSQVEV